MKLITYVFVLLAFPFMGSGQYTEFDWEERDTWMPVAEIFELAGIEKGLKVADIGCNEGYLTMHLAKAIGESGKVFAVDVKEYLLTKLERHLEDRDINNVQVILGDYDNPKLPIGSLDVVIIMDTYHEMDDYKDIMKHVHASLKPGGKLVIMEKLKNWVKNGSRNEQTQAHTLSPKYVKKEMKSAKFKVINEVRNMGDWENDDRKEMWILVAEKSYE